MGVSVRKGGCKVEINNMTTGKNKFDPVKHPHHLQMQKQEAVVRKENVTFAFQHNIVTEKNKLGVVLHHLSSVGSAKNVIVKELQTIVKLFSQFEMMLQTKQHSEQITKQLLNHIQVVMKQAQMEDIPLLDGTYDFIFASHKGKEFKLTLLDVSQLLQMVERDPSEVYRVISLVTMYIKELEQEEVWNKDLSTRRTEKHTAMWRALAEMSMTKLMQQWKEEVQERKWSAALFLLLIWMICICIYVGV